MRKTLFTVTALLLVALGAAADSQAQEKSKVDIRMEPVTGTTLQRIVAVAVVDAGIDTVWEQLARYENLGTQNPMLDVTYVAPEEKNDTREVHLKAGFPGPIPSLRCQFFFTKDEQAHAVTWVRKDGCFKQNTGSLVLESRGEQTLITFTAEIEVGKVLPLWAVSWALDRNIPAEIERIRHNARPVLATSGF